MCPSSFPTTLNNGTICNGSIKNDTNGTVYDVIPGECYRPEYVVFTWILCLVALTSILKLYYLIKTCLAIVNVAMYSGLLLVYYDVYYISSAKTST